MSGTFAYLLFLVHLFSVGLTASLDQEGLAPPQLLIEELVEPDETLTLTSFTWSYEPSGSQLVICAKDDLEIDGQNAEITLTLHPTDDDTIHDYGSGELNVDNRACVTLTAERQYIPLASTETMYQLDIHVTDLKLRKETYKHGSVSFAMTVESATFTCDGKTYMRLSGGDEITDKCTTNIGEDNTCYIDITDNAGPFCYNVSNTLDTSQTLEICPGNTNQYKEKNGSVVIDNLLYEDSDYKTAAISLSTPPDSPTLFEAIVLSTEASIQYCTIEAGECEIPDYAHGTTTYDVCTIAILDDPSTVETTFLSIRDLNANAYVDDNGMLQFRFVNLNPACLYSATIVDTAANTEETDLPTVNIDCTNVDAGHTCYGFLEAPETVDNKFLDIKFLAANGDAIEGTASNTIRVPYPALPTTAAPTQTPLQKS